MKKISLLCTALLLVFCIFSCSNDTSSTTTQDTVKKDTINRSSESFSNPH